MIGSNILNYRITDLIGEGGMGIVYLAEHQFLESKVAIKCLHPQYVNNKEVKERFLNEAIALSKLKHNNIVSLINLEQYDNNLYIIMEYVEGPSLGNYIEHINGPIHERKIFYIFNQILDAFSYAHSLGIIHRDIKPSNIILAANDTPKILDFGIAKILESGRRITSAGTRMGSVLYMSPEQILGKEIDLRTDIYSLGLTLYEMATGKYPYDLDENTDFMIQEKKLKEPFPHPKIYYPYISDHLCSVIYRATNIYPENRFRDCEEFKYDLNNESYLEPYIINAQKEIQTGFENNGSNYVQNLQNIEEPKKYRIVIKKSKKSDFEKSGNTEIVKTTEFELPYTYSCPFCKEDIELNEGEVSKGSFNCPVCNNFVFIVKSKLTFTEKQTVIEKIIPDNKFTADFHNIIAGHVMHQVCRNDHR